LENNDPGTNVASWQILSSPFIIREFIRFQNNSLLVVQILQHSGKLDLLTISGIRICRDLVVNLLHNVVASTRGEEDLIEVVAVGENGI
jgi:hypothetical protein